MESERSNGQMAQHISESFTTIIYMEREYTPGSMGVSTKENGEQIKCTAKVLSSGLTAANTSGSMLKTKNEVTENSSGQTKDVTEVSG
jgi:hypothetical protein